MVINDQGQIALKRLRVGQKLVRLPNGKAYVFIPKHNVSMAWVDPEDVPKIKSMMRDCCGGSGKPQFFDANESDVRIWEGKGER